MRRRQDCKSEFVGVIHALKIKFQKNMSTVFFFSCVFSITVTFCLNNLQGKTGTSFSLTSRIVHYVMQKKIRVVCQSSGETPANSSLRELLPQSLYFVFWPEFALQASHVYKVNNLTQ
jgi:hypothetical protein